MVLVGLAANASAVPAAPLRVRNGSSVRVQVHGKREAGIGLRPNPKGGGWRLEVQLQPDETFELVDVTEGANEAKWTVAPQNGAILLDLDRFIAGHAYRLNAKRGTADVGTALVYLYPPQAKAKSKVTFEDEETAGIGGDLEIQKKPTL
jgi:hypothetical protein